MGERWTSRRTILAGFAAASTVPASIGFANPGGGSAPDADLLALYGPLMAAWTEERRLLSADADIEAALDETKLIVERIAVLPAQTLAGLKVKAAACSWCHCGEPFTDDSFGEHKTTDVRLVSSILRDLLAMEVRA